MHQFLSYGELKAQYLTGVLINPSILMILLELLMKLFGLFLSDDCHFMPDLES